MKTIAQQLNWDFKTNGNLKIQGKKGNIVYWETSKGYWWDYQGRIIYGSGDSVKDKQPKPCENKIIEVDGIKYEITKIKNTKQKLIINIK